MSQDTNNDERPIIGGAAHSPRSDINRNGAFVARQADFGGNEGNDPEDSTLGRIRSDGAFVAQSDATTRDADLENQSCNGAFVAQYSNHNLMNHGAFVAHQSNTSVGNAEGCGACGAHRNGEEHPTTGVGTPTRNTQRDDDGVGAFVARAGGEATRVDRQCDSESGNAHVSPAGGALSAPGANIHRNGAFVAHLVAGDSEEEHATTRGTHYGAFVARANAGPEGSDGLGGQRDEGSQDVQAAVVGSAIPPGGPDDNDEQGGCATRRNPPNRPNRSSSQPPATRGNEDPERSARLAAAAAHIRCLVL